MSTPNSPAASSRHTRNVYIIKLQGTLSRLSVMRRSSHQSSSFSWALLVLPVNNDGGVVWFIPTNRWSGRPSWKRVEFNVDRERSGLTRLGSSTRSAAWINRLANQVLRDLDVNHGDECPRELGLVFCRMLGDLLLGEMTRKSSSDSTRDASKSAPKHLCGTSGRQCGADFCPSAPFHNTESEDAECMVIVPDGTVTIEEDEHTSNTISGSADTPTSTDDADSDAEPDSSEDDEETSSEYMETASQTSESTDASDEETNDDDATPASDSSGTYRRYRKVQVFMIRWESHDVETPSGFSLDKETDDVAAAFESFGYDVDQFLIPIFMPMESLSEFLESKMKSCMWLYDEDETLIIVWYGGHGGMDHDHCLRLASHADADTGGDFAWKDISTSFLEVNSDLLIFLNCCHAGASVPDEEELEILESHNKKFIKEVFCASGFDASASYATEYSLAPTFIGVLNRHRETADLNTSSLQRQMMHFMKGHHESYWHRRLDWVHDESVGHTVLQVTRERAISSNTPVKIEMTSGRPGAILLHPLPDPEVVNKLKRSLCFVVPDDEDEDNEDEENEDDEPPARRRKMNN
ncbi:hypothetical protein CkaCkLH20_11374 [Colletotrichum karsti]|uniref:Uncharacterized protein n=1 Tax=Colletotrichum karsti TaxID=1095194 RepID=A0A9P6HW40_9PEZI|nr:uncharacterized protein CkaCkLH20_11374 [Colletotrichum karsti]KAF9871205.1 hypothetical protein CkaCkLH20_11374 [Colletotrichum karsti]